MKESFKYNKTFSMLGKQSSMKDFVDTSSWKEDSPVV